MPTHRPWSNTYWLPGGHILCGEYPSDPNPRKAHEKLKALAAFGISTYINLTRPEDGREPYTPLPVEHAPPHPANASPPPHAAPTEPALPTEPAEPVPPTEPEVHHFPVVDHHIPTVDEMHTILDTVDHAAARGRTVYVHCVGGIGRTGTVAGCWLVRHGCSGTEALAIIAERWKTVAKHIWHWKSPDYGEQREFVMAWHEQTSPGNRIDFVRLERVIRGSLLGGAVGDARGAITNKTQMTLFSAEAMLRAEAQRRVSGTRSLEEVAFRAYQRWLRTQLDQGDSETPGSGWLMNQPELRHQRAPGKTCLASAGVASLALVSNNSKGCGGVMRAAPAGLFDAGGGAERAYDDGVALAHASHRHPAGYVAAGVLAVLIGALTEGDALDTAVHRALAAAAAHRMESPEVAESLEKAVRLAESGVAQSPELLRQLGAGRIAEEALAIAVYCALMADGDFARGVQLAVNHGGDSDSTGSISGSILGAALGVAAIPGRWVERVEAREVIVQIADDLLTGWRDGVKWAEMYPAN